MSAEIRYDGQKYWTIASRFHRNRDNKNMKPIAIFEMRTLLVASKSAAVKRRVQSFVSRHHDNPLGSGPNGGGPAVA